MTTAQSLTDADLSAMLADVLRGDVETIDDAARDVLGWPDDALPIVHGVSTFEDAGVLTSNAGLVVRFSDGSEFQVTVVRSR